MAALHDNYRMSNICSLALDSKPVMQGIMPESPCHQTWTKNGWNWLSVGRVTSSHLVMDDWQWLADVVASFSPDKLKWHSLLGSGWNQIPETVNDHHLSICSLQNMKIWLIVGCSIQKVLTDAQSICQQCLSQYRDNLPEFTPIVDSQLSWCLSNTVRRLASTTV